MGSQGYYSRNPCKELLNWACNLVFAVPFATHCHDISRIATHCADYFLHIVPTFQELLHIVPTPKVYGQVIALSSIPRL